MESRDPIQLPFKGWRVLQGCSSLGFREQGVSGLGCSGFGFRAYLWPEKPTFLGFLIMVSIYNFFNKRFWGAKGRVPG